MTTNVTLTTDAVTGEPDWLLIATAAQNFLMTNPSPAVLELTVEAAAGSPATVVGHTVYPNSQAGRYGTAGPIPPGVIYARIAKPAYEREVIVAVDTWT